MKTNRSVIALTVVLVAHLALLWLVLRPAQQPVVSDGREWVQLLLPVSSPPQRAALVKSGGMEKITAQPVKVPKVAIVAEPAPVASPIEQVGPEVQAAPKLEARTIPPEVLREAIKAAVASDHAMRAELGRELAPAPDSVRARLAKGLAAARAAVKLKLFEAPQMELISAPNDPKRIYRVTTSLGEYCLYYPDKGGISANSDPRSGRSEFGQPMASTCPIPF
ncbi:hypothetical protein ABT364_10185 [Massilia sp. SR12]